MSDGFSIAIAICFIASGAAGYERYTLQGHTGAAVFDAALMILGIVWLGITLDRILP